ncbi:hypothetical protein LTR08_006313 [Meristemomyces frigidus]|nr:hypothetical protein LTR08_006313 [Meristemomyces frigidus]
MADAVASPPSASRQPTPGIRIVQINDSIRDDEISCDCDIARPDPTQMGVHCRDCNNWQHMTCIIGEKGLTGVDTRRGYQCRVCRTAKRSEAAKKGYRSRMMKAQSTPLATPATPNATLRGRDTMVRSPSGSRLQKPLVKFSPLSKELYDVEDDDEAITVKRKAGKYHDNDDDDAQDEEATEPKLRSKRYSHDYGDPEEELIKPKPSSTWFADYNDNPDTGLVKSKHKSNSQADNVVYNPKQKCLRNAAGGVDDQDHDEEMPNYNIETQKRRVRVPGRMGLRSERIDKPSTISSKLKHELNLLKGWTVIDSSREQPPRKMPRSKPVWEEIEEDQEEEEVDEAVDKAVDEWIDDSPLNILNSTFGKVTTRDQVTGNTEDGKWEDEEFSPTLNEVLDECLTESSFAARDSLPSRRNNKAPNEDIDMGLEEPSPTTYKSSLPHQPTSAPKRTLQDVMAEWEALPLIYPGSEPKQQLPQRKRTLEDVLEEWQNTPIPADREISCDCPPEALASASHPLSLDDYIVCHACRRMQHKPCMFGPAANGAEEGDRIVQGEFCRACRRERYERYLRVYGRARHDAKQLAKLQHKNVTAFVEEVLWKQYCQTPCMPEAATELTSMYYDEGVMLPIHPPPKEWVVEVRLRVVRLTAAAGDERIRALRGADGVGLRYDEASLVAWRELAVWVVNRGAWKRKRAELGVLAEVLGLEDKGTFWKS